MVSKIKNQKSNIGQETLRVLVLNWRDPTHPLAGGAEISLLEHAKYWQRHGAEVTWVASSYKGAKKEEKKDGIIYRRKGSHFSVHFLFFISYILQPSTYNHEIVVDNFHFLPFFTPLFIKKKKIIVLINEVAGKVWFANLPYPLAWLGYKLEPFIFHFYRKIHFITASNSAKNELLKVGIPEKNITIIPHGVTLEKAGKKVKKENTPTLIFVGRVSKDKGIDDLLSCFSNIQNQISNIQLWIVGKEERPGMLREMLDERSWMLEEEKRGSFVVSNIKHPTSKIKYLGFVSEAEKFRLMKRAWILIHPSFKEGWGLNVIEANSVGTPAIGYDVPGLKDSIKDKETGVLCETNPESLKNAILHLLNDKKMYNKLSKNAKIWSKNFSWKKAGAKSWELIKA